MPDHKKSMTNQILDHLEQAFLRSLHAVTCALDDDTVALDTTTRETDSHATVLLANLTQDLTTASHEVAVMLGVDTNLILVNLVLKQGQQQMLQTTFN